MSPNRPIRLLRRWILLPLLCVGIVSLARAADEPPARDVFKINQMLGRGMNFGNVLDAPSEGEWGLSLKPEYFEAIAKAGFDSVRIPVRWAPHAHGAPDYTIEPAYFARVDWALDQASRHNLAVVLNIHHDEAAQNEPDKFIPRAAIFWKQIATRYKDRSDRLVFELLNEPNGAMTDEKWQASFPTLLAAIRESNPTRAVIVGPGHWNSLDSLGKLTLPEADRHLIVTFHDYNPFQFTHQGAEWSEGANAWLGKTWTASAEQLAAMRGDLDKAAAYGKAHNRPVYLGEFGVYNKADLASRVSWTTAITREAEARDIAWCYWEFGSGFGAYDPQTDRWRRPLLDALIPPTIKADDPTSQPKPR